jgi:hypothetical protein
MDEGHLQNAYDCVVGSLAAAQLIGGEGFTLNWWFVPQTEAEAWWGLYDLQRNLLEISRLELIKRYMCDSVAQVMV